MVLGGVLVVAVVFVAGFLWWQTSQVQLAIYGVSTTGRVGSTPDVVIRDNDSNYYRAWVVYRDGTGAEHRQYMRIPSGATQGSRFTVLYDPGNPTSVDWRGRGDHIGFALLVPAILLVAAVVALVSYRRAGRP